MNIIGELFYNMENHVLSDFRVPDVELVLVQPCEIQTVDLLNMEVVETTFIYVVIVALNDGSFVATRPLDKMELAHKIADKLSMHCKRYHDSL